MTDGSEMAYRGLGQASDDPVTGTAAWLASACAILAKEEDFASLLDDPFAARFAEAISPAGARTLALLDDSTARARYLAEVERDRPGALTVVAYRKPEIERMAADALAATGARQLVVLGAGCDTLSLRLARRGILPQVFEIDRPAVIELRRAVIAAAPLDTAHISGIAVDFERETLRDVLLGHGFDSAAPAVFIAEGLLGYLDPAAVDTLFATVREFIGDGRFVFSFTSDRRRDVLERQGEPVKFGLSSDDYERFLGERGFASIEMLTADDLSDRYAARCGGRIHVLPFLHLAAARRS